MNSEWFPDSDPTVQLIPDPDSALQLGLVKWIIYKF